MDTGSSLIVVGGLVLAVSILVFFGPFRTCYARGLDAIGKQRTWCVQHAHW